MQSGKIVYIGCSNYAAYRLVESLWTADKRNLSHYATLQAQYSLSSRALEREHQPLCVRHGIGILPWAPLAGGLLTGKYRRNQEPPTGSRMHKWKDRYKGFDNDRNWKIVDTLVAISKEIERPVSQIALGWLLGRPAVTSVIFGARTVAQLEENLGAGDLTLSEKAMAELDGASAFDLGYPYDFIKNIDGKW